MPLAVAPLPVQLQALRAQLAASRLMELESLLGSGKTDAELVRMLSANPLAMAMYLKGVL